MMKQFYMYPTLTFLLLLVFCTRASAGLIEASQPCKDRYRQLQEQSKQQRQEVKAKKEQARQSLKVRRRDLVLVQFPLEADDNHDDKTLSKDRPSLEQESLLEELESMIYLSSLIYAFASVRQIVREGGLKQSRWPWTKRKQLDNHEILLENDKDDNAPGCLKNALTGTKLKEILTRDNMERLSNDKELANTLNIDAIEVMTELGSDALLWEFDDQIGDQRELVYAITVNQVAQRITVIFRGSVSVRDWITNFTLGPRKLDPPACLQDFGLDDPVAVHSGFYDYLKKSKDHLLKELKEALKQYPGFEVVVTGHSLGGALASLQSYQLAETDMEGIPLPITCISYASPLVGNQSFQKAFSALERLGRLRHLRLSNELDVVPLSPPFSGYTQTGVNLHLQEGGKYTISYSTRQKKSFWSQLRPNSAEAHSLVSYWQRGREAEKEYQATMANSQFDALYISDLYERLLPKDEPQSTG